MLRKFERRLSRIFGEEKIFLVLRKFETRLSRIFGDEKMFLVLRKLGRADQVCERGERVLTGRWKIRNCARARRGLFIIC